MKRVGLWGTMGPIVWGSLSIVPLVGLTALESVQGSGTGTINNHEARNEA